MPMAGLLEFFQAPFFSRTVKAEPFETHWITGIIYKLHKITGSFLFLCSCFVFAKELFRDHIRCIQDGSEELGSRVQLQHEHQLSALLLWSVRSSASMTSSR